MLSTNSTHFGHGRFLVRPKLLLGISRNFAPKSRTLKNCRRRRRIHTYDSFTWNVEWHWAARMAGKEWSVVWMKRWSAIAELEFAVGKIRKTGRSIVETTRRQIHGEAAHFSGTAKERTPAHARQLLQSTFF